MRMRDRRIDFVKGVCILLLVWGHLPRMGTFHDVLENIVIWIYTFHVPIFVLISGYLFGNKVGTWCEMKLVVKRMGKPYFVMAIVSTILYGLAAQCGLQTTVEKSFSNWWALLCEIVVGRGGAALWYLHTVGVIELIVLMCLLIGRRRNVLSTHTWAIICLAVGCSMAVMAKFNLCVGAGFSIYFLIGYFLRRTNAALPNSWFYGLGVIIFIWVFDSPFNYTKIFWVMSVLGVFMALADSWVGRCRLGRLMEFFGRHTMALLLFHSVFACAYRPISPILLQIEKTGIGLNIIMFILVVASCVASERVINKTIIRKLLW